MNWSMLSPGELLNRLNPPMGKISMVLDTDTYNEVDDQFALAYALLSPEKLDVKAIYAAPFFNSRSNGPKDGMEKSYEEILRLLGKMGRSRGSFVFKGSECYLPGPEIPVDSPAARDLVQKAMAQPDGTPLYVVAIGAITNVASALLMEPKIVSKIVIVWLGGHPLDFPHTHEFNLYQDVSAARVVLNCGAPVTLIPCMGVASHLLSNVPELESCLGGKNHRCDALVELFAAYEQNHFAWGKEIWDVSAIAYLLNEEWVPTKLAHSPLLTDDFHWAHDERRHLIRVAYFCHRNPIFRDMFTKLATRA